MANSSGPCQFSALDTYLALSIQSKNLTCVPWGLSISRPIIPVPMSKSCGKKMYVPKARLLYGNHYCRRRLRQPQVKRGGWKSWTLGSVREHTISWIKCWMNWIPTRILTDMTLGMLSEYATLKRKFWWVHRNLTVCRHCFSWNDRAQTSYKLSCVWAIPPLEQSIMGMVCRQWTFEMHIWWIMNPPCTSLCKNKQEVSLTATTTYPS